MVWVNEKIDIIGVQIEPRGDKKKKLERRKNEKEEKIRKKKN